MSLTNFAEALYPLPLTYFLSFGISLFSLFFLLSLLLITIRFVLIFVVSLFERLQGLGGIRKASPCRIQQKLQIISTTQHFYAVETSRGKGKQYFRYVVSF